VIRTTIILFTLTSLVPLAHASEPIPSMEGWRPKAIGQWTRYHNLSIHLLERVLTPMVEKTSEGESFLGAQWERNSNNALTALAALKVGDPKGKHAMWRDAEIKAWTNIRKIGSEMMDHHYLMATTHKAIDQDVKDCKASLAYWEGTMSKMNSVGGETNDLIGDLNDATGEFAEISGIVGDLSKYLGYLNDHAKVASRIMLKFRAKKFQFIKEKDLKREYRDQLTKLKSAQMDPDGTGVFDDYEKKWEKTMSKTYFSYVAAVDNWRTANKMWTKDDQLWDYAASKLTSLATGSYANMLGVPIPPLKYADPEKLGEFILKWKDTLTKAVEKAKGEEWARLEKEIRSGEEEIKELKRVFQEQRSAAEDKAKEKAGDADKTREDNLKQIAKDLKKAYRELGKAGDDEAKDRAATKKIVRLKAQPAVEQRLMVKEQRYWMEVWREEQDQAAFDEFWEKSKAVEKRIKEYEELKPR
jgi:hypothetical protein